MSGTSDRERLAARVDELQDKVVAFCSALVKTDSQNPPGDTTALAAMIEDRLRDVPGVQLRRVVAKEPAVNLVAKLSGKGPGRRLVFNGHLDTFPIGDATAWSKPPLGGTIENGRIYGRGASDMKAGIAASVMAFLLLAEFRESWSGEAVLALVGDEETGGVWGTQYLLANVEEAVGDAMINGDAGSPLVARIGEKGNLWVKVTATGVPNHGAHVHLGRNAIETLLGALEPILALRDTPCPLPDAIAETIRTAKPISEPLSGTGESDTLQRITVNLGQIDGGLNINTIPDTASALLDIRLPPGVAIAEVQARIAAALDPLPDISWEVLSACEPNWTNPDHELVRLIRDNARAATGEEVAVNLRPGFSDARFYRQSGVPSVVYGVAANNMGGADEYATIDDLRAVFAVHALAAFDYLSTVS
ncbi:MAG: M20/M25/M40 family metallo-hydrolase [Alphaproteobacteria bacterium]|nr:M20/M25/M40 family metallo-hydrolase [Alphaproteobacteria bacterium]